MKVFLVEAGAVAKGYLGKLVESMEVYLAATNRLESDLRMLKGDSMEVVLAATKGSLGLLRGNGLKVFLAGGRPQLKEVINKVLADPSYSLYKGARILQSFPYADKFTENEVIPKCSDFMIDSGAFTFASRETKADWEAYVERYADFIRRNHVEKFFELDIDSLVGYDEVKRLRSKLERLTGKPSIPVWHKSRGKDEFLRMCDKYNYVAIGGIVSKEIVVARGDDKYFPWFINEAHKRGAKIHALGYSSQVGLKKYKFDSVDSSSWVAGNRYGAVYKFTGSGIKTISAPKGKWISTNLTALNNFLEWKKFSDWAYTRL